VAEPGGEADLIFTGTVEGEVDGLFPRRRYERVYAHPFVNISKKYGKISLIDTYFLTRSIIYDLFYWNG
jgi:hypothetical protein